MDLGLRDRRFLVGGGGRGLGAAIARALAGEGAKVAVIARESAELKRSADAIGAVPVDVDLSTREGPAEAVARAVEMLGGLDGLVINSGGPPAGRFEELDEAAWERAISGTLHSALRLTRESLPHLRAGRDPSILIVMSSSVREPIPGLLTSNVLRPGLTGLIKTLVDEIAPIRINGVAPGRFDTERVRGLDASRAQKAGISVEDVQAQARARIPLGRYGEPDELGRVAAFLLSPAASYLDGVVLPVDGGMLKSLP
ncbi:MAG: SDR family oxidoreductase [Candidatus Limnocylindrales bacterium]